MHYIVAAGGQSNFALGVASIWSGQLVPQGCRWVQNGIAYESGDAYPSKTNSIPAMIATLYAGGHTVEVYERSVNGISITSWMDTQMPLLVADMALAGAPPADGFLWAQGENESRTEGAASAYLSRLVGPRHEGPSLLPSVRTQWPGVRVLILELRHRAPGYGAFHARVRAAHHAAGDWHGPLDSVCIPSCSVELLPGTNQVHFSAAGHDTLGALWASEIMVPGSTISDF